MTLFGKYYREYFAKNGLLQQSGCGDAASVVFLADSDERTVATGKALAKEFFQAVTLRFARPLKELMIRCFILYPREWNTQTTRSQLPHSRGGLATILVDWSMPMAQP